MTWWLGGDARLSPAVRDKMADPAVRLLWSTASAFEVAVKVSVGKLRLARPVRDLFAAITAEVGAELLPILPAHCTEMAALPLHHRDPFDRMLVAQARLEHATLLSADAKLRMYDVPVLG